MFVVLYLQKLIFPPHISYMCSSHHIVLDAFTYFPNIDAGELRDCDIKNAFAERNKNVGIISGTAECGDSYAFLALIHLQLLRGATARVGYPLLI